jgi:putative peptidoglycan lipid II flippase
VPIATTAFPELSARSGVGTAAGTAADTVATVGVPGSAVSGDERVFDRTAAASTRAVLLASWLGAATLIGARSPVARVFEWHPGRTAALALALAAFAPGLVGYGLSTALSRVLYARGKNRAPALAVGGGWLLVIVADLLLVPFVPRDRVVPALGLGTTIGLTVAGIALLVLVRRERGGAALSGVARAFLAGLAGCAAGAAVGSVVASVFPVTGFAANVGMSVLAVAVVAVVFAVVVLSLDGGDLRGALSRLRARP